MILGLLTRMALVKELRVYFEGLVRQQHENNYSLAYPLVFSQTTWYRTSLLPTWQCAVVSPLLTKLNVAKIYALLISNRFYT